MSGGICGCTSGEGLLLVDSTQVETEAQDAAKNLQSAGQPPMTKHDPARNVSNAKVGNSCAKQNMPLDGNLLMRSANFLK